MARRLPRLRNRRLWPWLVGLALMLWLPSVVDGYAALNYYSHLALGEARILLQRQPITEIIADPATSEPLRDSLQTVLHARRFASETLALPNNGSYTTYVDISRPYVMYNVLATPELSLQPIRHCFLFAGCVAYKGFYSLARARASAARLRRAGNDVFIVGVPAYSTLGVFSDPVLSTMGGAGNLKLIGTIFHELAHQAVYIKGATAFNESFATFVSRQGLRQWRNARQLTLPDRSDALQRQHEFTQLVLAKRRELADLYASDLPVEVKRERKQGIFDELRAEYRNWRDTRWNGQ